MFLLAWPILGLPFHIVLYGRSPFASGRSDDALIADLEVVLLAVYDAQSRQIPATFPRRVG